MDDKPIVDTPNVFGVGAMQKMLNLEDAVLLESDLRAVTPAQHAARDTATAVRRLIRELESTPASIDELAELTQEIDRLVEVLAQSDSDSSATSAKTSVHFIVKNKYRLWAQGSELHAQTLVEPLSVVLSSHG